MTNEELVKLYQEGNKKALDKLLEDNKRIVYKIANKFKITNNSIDNDDLIQEGMLGLIIAADKYNFEKENGHSNNVLICTNSDHIEKLDELVNILIKNFFHYQNVINYF